MISFDRSKLVIDHVLYLFQTHGSRWFSEGSLLEPAAVIPNVVLAQVRIADVDIDEDAVSTVGSVFQAFCRLPRK